MQCPSCKFENMPSITSCGRCGANLAVQTMTLDVHPPRAEKWRKRVRKPLRPFSKLRAALSQFRTNKDVFWDIVESGRAENRVSTNAVLFRMIFPGWAQRYLGFRVRGWCYSASWLFCMSASLLLIGSYLGAMLFGLAVMIHTMSCVELLMSRIEGGLRHWLESTGLATLILIVGYLLLLNTTYTYLQVLPLRAVAAPFATGDVLIASRGDTARVGDIVVYELPRAEVGTPGRLEVWRGQRVDRILAGPGQKVSLKNGELLIDGAAPQIPPLNPVHFSGTVDVVIGPRQWFILPSTDTTASYLPVATVCVVNQSAVQGVVLFRSYPLTRYGRITSIE